MTNSDLNGLKDKDDNMPLCETLMDTDTKAASSSSTNLTTNYEDSKLKSDQQVSLNIVYKKERFTVKLSLDSTIENFKKHIQPRIDVLPYMQKVMVRGLAHDSQTLRELGVANGSKIMVIGSTIGDVLSVNECSDVTQPQKATEAPATKEKLCQMKSHRKILDKGKPDDAMMGYSNANESLPLMPLTGMLNKGGVKVRLTFKLELDQLWISTKERTNKVAMTSIKSIVSEPIEGHEAYHVMGIQLGTTEISRYWLYWVPAQYVQAIRFTVLGR